MLLLADRGGMHADVMLTRLIASAPQRESGNKIV